MGLSLEQELEELARANIEALNARNFAPDSPIWQRKMKNWTAQAQEASKYREMNLDDFVKSVQHFISVHPNFHIRIVDLMTTVDFKGGLAEVYMNIETTGNPSVDVFKRSVTKILYCRVDGVWLSGRHEALPGMTQDNDIT